MLIYGAVLTLFVVGFGSIGYRVTSKITTFFLTGLVSAAVNIATNLMLHHYGAHLLTVPQQFALTGIVVIPWLYSVVAFAYGIIKPTAPAVSAAILANAFAIFSATVFAFDLIH